MDSTLGPVFGKKGYLPGEFLDALEEAGTGWYGFNPNISAVIVGPCSSWLTPVQQIIHDIPKALSCLPFADGSSVLLLSSCCGPYPPNTMKAIQESFPHIVWVTPATRDFVGHVFVKQVIEDLVHARVIALGTAS